LDDTTQVFSVETVIEERKKAEEKYDDAVAEGDKMAVMATYVTRSTKHMVKVQMGNFPPRS